MMVQPWVFYYEDSMNDDLIQKLKPTEESDDLLKEDQKKECEKNLKNPEFLWTIPGVYNEECSDN